VKIINPKIVGKISFEYYIFNFFQRLILLKRGKKYEKIACHFDQGGSIQVGLWAAHQHFSAKNLRKNDRNTDFS
jgi:hypothetical protein